MNVRRSVYGVIAFLPINVATDFETGDNNFVHKLKVARRRICHWKLLIRRDKYA